MKKIMLLAVLLVPCVPSFMVGVESQADTDTQRREVMLNERFAKWCYANGYDYATMDENFSETLWLDVWSETDDYCNALDSIDQIMSVKTMLNESM